MYRQLFPRVVLIAVGIMITLSGAAQTVQYERLLLPLVIGQPQPGAYGSLWVTSLTITNPLMTPVPWFSARPGGKVPADKEKV